MNNQYDTNDNGDGMGDGGGDWIDHNDPTGLNYNYWWLGDCGDGDGNGTGSGYGDCHGDGWNSPFDGHKATTHTQLGD